MAPGDPKSEKIDRQVSKSDPKGTKREPKGAKSELKVSQKGSERERKGAKRAKIVTKFNIKINIKDKVAKSMVFWLLKLILFGSVLGWNSIQNQ